MVDDTSECIMFHLKRITPMVDEDGIYVNTKTLTPVTFENELPDFQGHKWGLRGVIKHVGEEAEGGHYLCYCKLTPTGKWFKCDGEAERPDVESITIVQDNEVLQTEATVLCYRKLK